MKLESEMAVREVMETTFVAAKEDQTVKDITVDMRKRKIASAIILREGEPIGIITEADIIDAVIVDEKDPKATLAKDIMSKPLFTVPAGATLSEAANLMDIHNIRHVPVVDKNKILGVVTAKDIAAIEPHIYETIYEKRITRPEMDLGPNVTVCEFCGGYSAEITESNGKFVCPDCKHMIE